MQSMCPHCGYLSDRPTRFCRQCGNPLSADTGPNEATTRNIGRQQAQIPQPEAQIAPPYAPYQQYAPGNVTDEQTPETSRFYQPPAVPGYQMPAPAPQKSNGWKILLVALFAFLLIGGGFSALIISALNRQSQPVPEQIEDQVRKRVEEELARAQEQIEDAARQAELHPPDNVPNPPAPPLPGQATGGDLEKYRYPKAETVNTVNLAGQQFLKMTTNDSVDKVTEHYKKLVGPPSIQSNDEDGKKVIFQVQTAPTLMVVVNQDEDYPDKTQIVVLRTSLRVNLN